MTWGLVLWHPLDAYTDHMPSDIPWTSCHHGVPWIAVLRALYVDTSACLARHEQGIKIPKKPKSDTFDSNTITPGTPFMDRLATALQYYVHKKMNNDPGWKGVEVGGKIRVVVVAAVVERRLGGCKD